MPLKLLTDRGRSLSPQTLSFKAACRAVTSSRALLLCCPRGRSPERIFLVPHTRQRLPGVSPPLLLPVLRRLGRLGPAGRSDHSRALHPEATRHAPDVGGATRARGCRALASGAPYPAFALASVAPPSHSEPDALRVNMLAHPPRPHSYQANP